MKNVIQARTTVTAVQMTISTSDCVIESQSVVTAASDGSTSTERDVLTFIRTMFIWNIVVFPIHVSDVVMSYHCD